jgi:hypothetical protein
MSTSRHIPPLTSHARAQKRGTAHPTAYWVTQAVKNLVTTRIWNERHLRHALREYETFYNSRRPHQGIANARPLRQQRGSVRGTPRSRRADEGLLPGEPLHCARAVGDLQQFVLVSRRLIGTPAYEITYGFAAVMRRRTRRGLRLLPLPRTRCAGNP